MTILHHGGMCGRFAVTTDPAQLAREIDALDETGIAGFEPNYNVAPTTGIAAVVARHDEPDDRATRRIRLMRWGLLPSWVKAGPGGRPLTKSQLINARADKVAGSPAFREAARHKRCLIPMDGYYEWMPSPEKGRKTPFYIYRDDGRPLLMAGLWSVWKPKPDSAPILTCTIVTTDAVGELARVHDRMPLPVGETEWDHWLDPDRPVPTELLDAPADVSGIVMREVSTLVNNVAHNGPALIAPAEPGNQPVGLF